MLGARFLLAILAGCSEAHSIQSEGGLSERLLLKLSTSVRSMTVRSMRRPVAQGVSLAGA